MTIPIIGLAVSFIMGLINLFFALRRLSLTLNPQPRLKISITKLSNKDPISILITLEINNAGKNNLEIKNALFFIEEFNKPFDEKKLFLVNEGAETEILMKIIQEDISPAMFQNIKKNDFSEIDPILEIKDLEWIIDNYNFYAIEKLDEYLIENNIFVAFDEHLTSQKLYTIQKNVYYRISMIIENKQGGFYYNISKFIYFELDEQ